jgi:formylglycine-generating enzyme required for sulfatase activity
MFRVPAGRLLPFALLSSLAVAFLLLDATQAQTGKGKKYGLLVGVKEYRHSDLRPLDYTENDVVELAEALRGFTEVVVLTTSAGEKKPEAAPTAKNIRAQLKRLLEKVTRHDTMLIALAGHGLQLKLTDRTEEEAFFCPADAKPGEDVTFAEQSRTMISFSELFQELKVSGVGVKLLLVDACRNNPAAGRSINAETVPLARAPNGLAALFSCSSGERAFETPKLGKGHGVFFHHVIQGLKGEARNKRGEVTWDSLAIYVKEQVSDEVPKLFENGAKQTPDERKTLKGKPPVIVTLAGGSTEEPPAKKEVVKKKSSAKEEVVKGSEKEITNSIGMKLVRIPAGTFTMGSPEGEVGRGKGEEQHAVEITKDFSLGAHEVTQRQYQRVMGKNPSYFRVGGGGMDRVRDEDTDDFPVESVSWHDAVAFCEKMSALPAERKAGRRYRLPTEAEWEYACRGGDPSSRPFSFGSSLSTRQANFDGSQPFTGSGKGDRCKTRRVGSGAPNGFGLYDMHGNVAEWCADWLNRNYYARSRRSDPQGPATGANRVHRGGCCNRSARFCRSANRDAAPPSARDSNLGFRVAQVPSEK